MVAVISLAVEAVSTGEALSKLDARLAGRGQDARFVYVFYGCDHSDDSIRAYLLEKMPAAAFLGGTSCSGVMSEGKIWGAASIGLLIIEDNDGDYGVGAAEMGSDPAATAEAVLHSALANAGCPGELPELIWVFQAPGCEEQIIEGLRRIVDDRCPILGGSAADNTVAGAWRQISPAGVFKNGIVIAVMFPSGGVGYSYQGGYEPAGPSGVVTRTGSGRKILEIDGAPAAVVYNQWTDGLIAGKLESGGNILADTTMHPLAVDAGQIDGVAHYLLIHPDSVAEDFALTTFADVQPGTRLYSMRGSRSRLIERAGRVVGEAAARLPSGASSLAGGLVVYCAGCMLAVGPEMPQVASTVQASFGGMPHLGCFTFGEQGCLADRNVHGNLMISAVVFGQ